MLEGLSADGASTGVAVHDEWRRTGFETQGVLPSEREPFFGAHIDDVESHSGCANCFRNLVNCVLIVQASPTSRPIQADRPLQMRSKLLCCRVRWHAQVLRFLIQYLVL